MKKIKLFCFPHAGGFAYQYLVWKKYLNNLIELYPVELAGRGKRLDTTFYENFDDAIEDTFNYVSSYLNGSEPYAFFGHSMGALLAYEVSCELKKKNQIGPIHLFLSSKEPPHIKKSRKNYSEMNENDFKKEILKFQGIPNDIFINNKLSEYFIPILRADFNILEKYKYYKKNLKLNCPISILYGNKDKTLQINNLHSWNEYSKEKYNLYKFEGGHFYIKTKFKDIVKLINKTLISI